MIQKLSAGMALPQNNVCEDVAFNEAINEAYFAHIIQIGYGEKPIPFPTKFYALHGGEAIDDDDADDLEDEDAIDDVELDEEDLDEDIADDDLDLDDEDLADLDDEDDDEEETA